MVPAQTRYQLYIKERRPDLWKFLDQPSHPLNTVWPEFLDQDPSYQCYEDKLCQYQAFARFQFILVEVSSNGEQSIVACSRSVPFFWPELHHFGGRDAPAANSEIWNAVPDGGYDSILAQGVEQYLFREGLPPLSEPLTEDQLNDVSSWQRCEPPNALSVLLIVVRLARRSQGLAEIMITAMKQVAMDEKLELLVVPFKAHPKTILFFQRHGRLHLLVPNKNLTWRT